MTEDNKVYLVYARSVPFEGDMGPWNFEAAFYDGNFALAYIEYRNSTENCGNCMFERQVRPVPIDKKEYVEETNKFIAAKAKAILESEAMAHHEE